MELGLIFFFTVVGIVVAMCFGIRNAKGVFIIYFLSGVTLPYIFFMDLGYLPTFLNKIIDPQETPVATLLMSLAFAVTMISASIGKAKKNNSFTALRIRASRVQFFSAIAILFFLIYLVMSIIFAGSVQNAILSSYARVRTNSSLANVRSIFFWGNVVFSTFAFYGMRFSSPPLKVSILVYLSVLTSCVLAALDGGRAILILFVLSLFAQQILTARTSKLIIYGMAGVTLITVLSYFMLTWRYKAQGASIISDNALSISGAFTGLAFIDHFQLSLQYARDVGFDYGSLYVNAFLSFLPRAIFPGKAVPLSAQMRGYVFGDETGGVPPGFFGESYIFAGVFGLIIMSILYGRFLLATSRLCNKAVQANCPIRYATAGIMVPLVGFTLIRGGLDIGVLRVGLPFLWIFVASKLATRQR